MQVFLALWISKEQRARLKNQALFTYKKSRTFDHIYLILSTSENWDFKYKAASFSNYQNI